MSRETQKNGKIHRCPFPIGWLINRGWVNYNDLTATSLEIIVSKGNHPKMALIQVCELR